jgi:hypothetical protein
MNINEQLENLLANLGVQMEYNPHERNEQNDDDTTLPEVSIFQASRDHYGVFYRLDIIDSIPQLRILVPIEHGAVKMEMYLVRLNSSLPLNAWFAGIATYHGSIAFEKGREAALQHLLYAVAEMMKQLFWSGDLNAMTFPPELDVCRIL